jgi:DNA modification methylase
LDYINRIILGNSYELIKDLPEQSINSIITSPPFLWQRESEIRGYIGNEPRVEDYVNNIVDFFESSKTILKEDATIWLNIGEVFRNKQVVGVPWRVAFAMQKADWKWVDTIVWNKMNKCFGGHKKRTTLCHEFILVFALNYDYYYDADAIKEKGSVPKGKRGAKGSKERYEAKGVNARPPVYWEYTGFRNKRSVWSVQPKPSRLNHYSMYPVELVEPCVLVSCPEDGLILDPFCGTGSTGIACTKHKRNFVGFDIDPENITKAQKRLSEAHAKYLTKPIAKNA